MEETLNLVWSWREELNRGGFKCTILTHIHALANPVNIQNKKKLHWRMFEIISIMYNEVEFVVSTHNLLLKKAIEGEGLPIIQEHDLKCPSFFSRNKEKTLHIFRL
jgi:hypothetical protein